MNIMSTVSMKLVFLPHCLRSLECKAKLTEQGYICLNCGKCKIGSFKSKAEEKGYNVFIVPGASMVKKILEGCESPERVIGVACEVELKEAAVLMKKKGMMKNAKALKLLTDGCVNTEADFDNLYNML